MHVNFFLNYFQSSAMPSRTGQTLNSSWHTGIVINTYFFHRYSLRYPENIRRIDIVHHSITDPGCLSRIRTFPHLGSMGQKEPNEVSGFRLDPDLIRLLDSDPDLGSVSVFS
jgi:hypothetical protein